MQEIQPLLFIVIIIIVINDSGENLWSSLSKDIVKCRPLCCALLHKLCFCFAGSLFHLNSEHDLMSFINIKGQIWSILRKRRLNLIMLTLREGNGIFLVQPLPLCPRQCFSKRNIRETMWWFWKDNIISKYLEETKQHFDLFGKKNLLVVTYCDTSATEYSDRCWFKQKACHFYLIFYLHLDRILHLKLFLLQ